MRQFINDRIALASLCFIAVIAAFAVLAPFWTTHNPEEMDASSILASPSQKHLMGTDSLGRDIFSRIVYGSRISLSI